MRQVVNFIITGVILAISAWWFPQYVQIDGFITLVLAALLLFVAEGLAILLYFALVVSATFTHFWAGIVAAISLIFMVEIFALTLVDLWLAGLVINGFWPKFFIALALSIFRIQDTSRN